MTAGTTRTTEAVRVHHRVVLVVVAVVAVMPGRLTEHEAGEEDDREMNTIPATMATQAAAWKTLGVLWTDDSALPAAVQLRSRSAQLGFQMFHS